MRRRIAWALILSAALWSPARTEDLSRSPLPPARPVAAAPVLEQQDPMAVTEPAAAPTKHPAPRPAVEVAAAPEVSADLTGGISTSPQPRARPKDLSTEAEPAAAAPAKAAKVGTKGALCGDKALQGVVLAPISSRVRGCGVAEPVSLQSVAGVRLNPAATLDCTTAEALKTWVKKGLQPAFAPRQVVELQIYGSYVCRPRNNVRGAKISEHGRGKAIDIGAFVLDNGKSYSVESNYNATIRKAQRAACGPFGTTLGPGSDGYHENHIHLDTANYDHPYCH